MPLHTGNHVHPCDALRDREDLIRRVKQAIQLAGRALHFAESAERSGPAPPARNDGRSARPGVPTLPDESESRSNSRLPPLILEKVVAESSMLLSASAFLREDRADMARTIDELATRLAPHARGDAVFAELCSNSALAPERAAAHIHLRELGSPDARMDAFLEEVMAGHEQAGPERLPNHVLERAWLAQLWSGVEDLPLIARLLQETCVAKPNSALASSTADLYAFTHAVLYASNMGRRSVAWPRSAHDITSDCEVALAAAIDADNFDLTAELLWTWPMGGMAWSPAATFCFSVLAATQDRHGFLPGPDFVESEGSGEDFEEYIARSSYHTTLVMGFLCAASLRAGASCPPTQVGPTMTSTASTERILLLLAPRPKRRWEGLFEHLDLSQKHSIAPFLLTIALRRAYASKNVARVQECLEVALSCDLAEGAACRDALGFLRRARVFAQARENEAGLPR